MNIGFSYFLLLPVSLFIVLPISLDGLLPAEEVSLCLSFLVPL
jgi:hypothetical protein